MQLVQNEIGRQIDIDLGTSVAGNTEITVVVRKPDGTTFTVTRTGGVVVVDDPTTGAIHFLSGSQTGVNHLNLVGEYIGQVRVDFVSPTRNLKSRMFSFFVDDSLV